MNLEDDFRRLMKMPPETWANMIRLRMRREKYGVPVAENPPPEPEPEPETIYIQPPDPERLRTIAEVASVLRIRQSAVRAMIADGQLEAVRVGNRLKIRPQALERFFDEHRVLPLAKMRKRIRKDYFKGIG